MSCDPTAYSHPGCSFSKFPDISPAAAASPAPPDDEYELDDISGCLPPPSSSPIVNEGEDSFPCEDEIDPEETISDLSVDGPSSCAFLRGLDIDAEAESTNILDRQKTKSRLLSEPLDCVSQVVNVQFYAISDLGVGYGSRDLCPSTRLGVEKKFKIGSSASLSTFLPRHGNMRSGRRSGSHYIEAHSSSRLRISKTLRATKSLSTAQPTTSKPSEGPSKGRRILSFEHLRDFMVQEPPRKKARIGRLTSLPKIRFSAKEPASLRRAQSLISYTSTGNKDKLLEYTDLSTDAVVVHRTLQLDSPICPPTVPVTPLPDTADYLHAKRNPLARTPAVRTYSKKKPKMPPVPIIAPPPCPNDFAVKCEEDFAEDRIKVLLTKERGERESDGLDLPVLRTIDICSNRSSSSSSVSDDNYWADESSLSATETVASHNSDNTSLSTYRARRHDRWTRALGIDAGFRKEVVGWMLDVLPSVSAEQPLSKSRIEPSDLFDQLDTCFNTRYHAVHLFHRYFLRVAVTEVGIKSSEVESISRGASGNEDSLADSEASDDEEAPGSDDTAVMKEEQVSGYECRPELDGWQDGLEAATWDIALGCLALCVKLDRDFLGPLNPVYATEFLDLARHSVSYEDLEVSQRDILSAFGFNLGSITPQSFMDELWLALPTLRKATKAVKDGWKSVQLEIWDRLFDALLEPDFVQFPISLLTASALLDGLIIALTRHLRYEAELKASSSSSLRLERNSWCRCCNAPCVTATKRVSWHVYVCDATNAVKDVVLDVLDVLQIRDEDLERCRAWMNLVGRE